MSTLRSRRCRVAGAAALAALLAGPAGHTSVRSRQVGVTLAVIVHPGVPVDDITIEELRRIFLGDRQFWNQELRITPLVPAPGSAARATLLGLCQKSEAQYRHHWIAKVFRAEASTAPKVVFSPSMAGDLVRAIAGAISVVDAAQVPRPAKVLTVNGKRPEADDYPLR